LTRGVVEVFRCFSCAVNGVTLEVEIRDGVTVCSISKSMPAPVDVMELPSSVSF
jgi:hypothetical protein